MGPSDALMTACIRDYARASECAPNTKFGADPTEYLMLLFGMCWARSNSTSSVMLYVVFSGVKRVRLMYEWHTEIYEDTIEQWHSLFWSFGVPNFLINIRM